MRSLVEDPLNYRINQRTHSLLPSFKLTRALKSINKNTCESQRVTTPIILFLDVYD
jgi:hypothetical protein